MKQNLLLALLVFSCSFAFSQQLIPISRTTGKLNITVDPRMELISAVQVISDYPLINRENPYSREMIQFFSKDSTNEASRITEQLYNDYDFSYDAPIDLMLRLSQVPELKTIHPYSERMIERAHGKDNLDKYSQALHHFAIRSNFAEFWTPKIPFYDKMVKFTADDLGDYDPVGKLEQYYNESKSSYTVTLSPSFAGGYGIRIPTADNNFDIYGCIDAPEIKEGIPYYSKFELSFFLWHEFSHSFVNPLTDQYKERVNACSGLYQPLGEISSNRWITCVNEHIIRAIYVRLKAIYISDEASVIQLIEEKSRGFAYIEPLIEKLKQFEQARDAKQVTFTQYYPELLGVFDSLTHTDNTNLINPPFNGPIISAINSANTVAIIYPTYGSDTTGLMNVYNYTSRIYKMKNKESILCADTTALKMDLSGYWIMAYGTIESNLFLQKYKATFPFTITGNAIYADTKYVGENLRLITCLPNPFNNKKGMMINTATNNQWVKPISFPFTDDYIVFVDQSTVLKKGNYNKGNNWAFK